MQTKTEDILSSIMGDEMKIEVAKRDNIIRALDAEIKSLQDKCEATKKDLFDLETRKAGLSDEIINAYKDKDEALAKDKENFEKIKNASIDALDTRESLLTGQEASYETRVKNHEKTVSDFNAMKEQFENKKKAIADTLAEAGNAHSNLFKEAVSAIKGA